jgi:lipoprotein-anchoring transpeptidase ErfK/SrfK
VVLILGARRSALGARLFAAVSGMLVAIAPAKAQERSLHLGAAAARDSARLSDGFRVIVSIGARRLWVVNDTGDTLLAARAAVGSGRTLSGSGQRWTFQTPRGVHTVIGVETDPVWIPPDWFYVEDARRNHLKLDRLELGRPVTLSDGRRLLIRDCVAGVIDGDSVFQALPTDEHIVFDGRLFMPPIGTKNRRAEGTLGSFRLLLGGGIGIHGTSDPSSVGRAVTHGCIRLGDADIAWLYEHVPVGTRVYIY